MDAFVTMFLNAVQSGEWKVATVIAVCALVLLVKRYVGRLSFLDVFKTVRGNAILAVLVAAASAVLGAVGVGQPITVTLLLAGLTATLFDQIVTGEA